MSVGHCHPYVIEKVKDQVGPTPAHDDDSTCTPTAGLFAKKLAEHMPEGSGLTVSYFTNSGSEANELAVLMAREHTGHADVISLRNGYHGGTQATMALTAVGTWKFPTSPVQNVRYATPGYCYRCPFGLTYPSCDVKCARDTADLIRYETSGVVAAFLGRADPGGRRRRHRRRPEYFPIVYDAVRKARAACASPTKCKPASAARANIFGGSRIGASRPTSSPWPRESATASRWARASPGPRSRRR